MADSLDLEILQGDTFRWIINIQDATGAALDLTGYTVRGQLRKSYSDLTDTETFTVAYTTPRTTGQVILTLSALETAAIAKGSYKYDVELEADDNATENDAEVHKLYRGSAVVLPEATKL